MKASNLLIATAVLFTGYSIQTAKADVPPPPPPPPLPGTSFFENVPAVQDLTEAGQKIGAAATAVGKAHKKFATAEEDYAAKQRKLSLAVRDYDQIDAKAHPLKKEAAKLKMDAAKKAMETAAEKLYSAAESVGSTISTLEFRVRQMQGDLDKSVAAARAGEEKKVGDEYKKFTPPQDKPNVDMDELLNAIKGRLKELAE